MLQDFSRARRMRRTRSTLAYDRLEPRALMAAWVEQGTTSTFFGQAEGIVGNGTAARPDNPVSGAVEAIAAHPTNPDIAYLASANGGIWRTTNATAAFPTWTPLGDQLPSLTMGAIAFSPLDTNFNTLYAGTGRYSSFGDGITGRGVYKTTDGGSNWTVLNPGGIFTGRDIKDVVPTTLTVGGGQVILVGSNSSNGGVYRSTDGGTSWARLSGNGTSGLPGDQGVTNLEADPTNANRFYAGVLNTGVFRSDDGGVTWTARNTGIVTPANANTRVEVAPSAAGSGVVFAALLRNGIPYGFYRSANAGDNWTAMDLAGTNEAGGFVGTNPGAEANPRVPNPNDPGGQGRIHFALLADRTNANVVFVSGDRQDSPFPNSIGARDFSGRVFRGDASAAAGSQWRAVTNSGADPDGTGPLPGTSPHADSRDMVFDANGNILQANDGGIYRLLNPNNTNTAGGRQWVSINGSLRVTEFHSIGYSSISDTILGGTQDTGTPVQLTPNSTTGWIDYLTADGGVVGVDDLSTPGVSIRYTSFQRFGAFNRMRVNSAGAIVVSFEPVPLIVNGTGGLNLFQFDNTIQFYQPYEINAVDGNRMIIGTNSLYESTNRGDSLNFLGGNATIRAMAYGGRYRGVANPGVIYLSDDSNGGRLSVRPGDGQPFADVSAAYRAAGGFEARDIVLDPQNWRRAFAYDFNGNVLATFNAGGTWINITGNLASQLPAGGSLTDLRTITFIGNSANYDNAIVAVGGYGGVYATRSPGLAGTTPTWIELGTGMPNSLTFDLRYNAADDILVAGVLGRSAWTLVNPAASLPPGDGGGGFRIEGLIGPESYPEGGPISPDVDLDGRPDGPPPGAEPASDVARAPRPESAGEAGILLVIPPADGPISPATPAGRRRPSTPGFLS